jgi:predicted nucleic acid-binding protein
VKILVDANIVFNGILNSNGKIGDLPVNSLKHYTFIAPDFLRYEIKSKYQRLGSISGMSSKQISEAEYQVCKNITFISEEQITDKCWVEALALVHDIDKKIFTTLLIQYSLNVSYGLETKSCKKG